ncbi:MAG: DUF4097 family beta strand repeat-containing protein [Solirubrobacteraceae bacterium]
MTETRRAGTVPHGLLAGSAVVALLLFAGGALALAALVLDSTTTSARSIPVTRAIDVRTLGGGDLEVAASAGRGARLTTREQGALARPHVRVSSAAGRLTLRDGCASVPFSRCRASFRLEVPAGTRVRLETGPGDVRVSGRLGATDARAGSGDVMVIGASAPLRLRTGSGDVHAETTGPDVDAESGSGDVDLRAPRARSVRLRAGSGDVTARVADAPYSVRADTGSGDERVTVPTDPRAPRSIDARTGSGDVRLASVS